MSETEILPEREAKTQPKPGLKTSEFWLALGVALGAAVAAVYDEAPIARIIGMLAASLSAAGYSFSRGLAKR